MTVIPCYCGCTKEIATSHPSFPFFSEECHMRYLQNNPLPIPLKENGKPRRTIAECIALMKSYAKHERFLLEKDKQFKLA